VRHFKRIHNEVSKDIWRKVAKYIKRFPCNYKHSTIELPEDGSEAQAILAVQSGWECTACRERPFHSIGEKGVKQHRTKSHTELKGLSVKETARKVLMQSWYSDNRARYWRIEKVADTGNVDVEQERVPHGRAADTKGCDKITAVERVASEGQETSIVVQRQRREGARRRRVTGVRVQAAGEGTGTEVEGNGRKPIDKTKEGEVVTANSAKRRASIR
jgi:hypothetical protein